MMSLVCGWYVIGPFLFTSSGWRIRLADERAREYDQLRRLWTGDKRYSCYAELQL